MTKFLLRAKKIPTLRFVLMLLFLCASATLSAQTISSVAPSKITFRSQIVITGTNLTGATVRVNNTSITKISNTATMIVATIPTFTPANGALTAVYPVTVQTTGGQISGGMVTYIKPTPTITGNAKVTRVITDYQGYWSSTSPTSVKELQPDRQHSVSAIEYGGVIYSTGVADGVLTSKGISFKAGDFKALPVDAITGTTPTSSAASNYFAMASRMDGSATTGVASAPEIKDRRAKDVLIDGVKGLGLGTGMTNIGTGSVFEFTVTDIAPSRINDAEPDILVSQIASPTSNDTDIYYFTDAAGNIVGNPITVVLSSIPAVGTYKLDLFNITFSSAYADAKLTTIQTANGVRDIRLVGYRLSDFGITIANEASVRGFKIVPSGISDPAFIAYNANSMLIPAPRITSHPASVVACTGQGSSTTFSVTATGNNLVYRWKKNGTDMADGGNISGVSTPTITITNVSATDVATYTCEVTNAAGSVLSNPGYLNTIIAVQPAATTTACLNVPGPVVDVIANGLSLSYQWYSNTVNNNTTGTLIPGATNYYYAPPANTPGTRYYYAVIENNGQGCARETSLPGAFTVGNVESGSGNAYIGGVAGTNNNVTTTSVCAGATTVLRVAGATGGGLSYQWEKSADGVTGWLTPFASDGTTVLGNTANYTTPALTETAYYRVRVTTSSCILYSNILTVTVGAEAGAISGNQSICSGNSTTVTVTGATGPIQWQQSVDGLSGWSNITGATEATYTTPALTQSVFYRAAITGTTCTVPNTGSAHIVVNPGADAGAISSNQSVCTGADATVSLTGPTGTIQWQQSADGLTGWADIAGATEESYTAAALTATTCFRAIVSVPTCNPATSAVTTVTVKAPPATGSVSANQEICPGTITTVSVSGTTGTLQWQQSADGLTGWVNVTGGIGASTAAYTTAALPATTYFRAVITENGCTAYTAVTTVTVRDTYIWNGSVNTNWHVAGNWSCNVIPTLAHNVVIPQTANQPVVSSGTTALGKTLTIQAGAILTINAMNNIHILGAVTVNTTGNMIVNSTANLIQDAAATTNTNVGTITVKRESSALYRQDYTLWSTPVAGQKLFQFSPQTVANRFYTYSTLIDLYVTVPNLSAASATTFDTGVAYLIRMPNGNAAPGYNAGTTPIIFKGQFKGKPNNGTINVPVSLVANRYNGIGNPYPSAINVHSFIDQNATALDNLGTLYFWRKKNDNNETSYASVTKFAYSENEAEGGNIGAEGFLLGEEDNWIINTGQGFIVRATPGTSHITFNNAMRRDMSSGQFFRTKDLMQASKFKLNLSSATGDFNQTVIGYSNLTTNGLDYGYDGILLNDGPVAIYTAAQGTDLAIQAKGQFATTDVVPVTYRVTNPGTYTVTFKSPYGLFAGTQQVYLKDKATGITHNIKDGAYSFTTAAGTFNSRFEVVYTDSALSTGSPEFTTGSFVVYKQDNTLHVDAGTTQLSSIRIFDTRGRMIYERKGINATTAAISDLRAEQQVLILQATTAGGTAVSKKVMY
jgi:hypothetical protein